MLQLQFDWYVKAACFLCFGVLLVTQGGLELSAPQELGLQA